MSMPLWLMFCRTYRITNWVDIKKFDLSFFIKVETSLKYFILFYLFFGHKNKNFPSNFLNLPNHNIPKLNPHFIIYNILNLS